MNNAPASLVNATSTPSASAAHEPTALDPSSAAPLRVVPRERNGSSKREALLAAMRDEFAANGFLGTHVAVLAARVDIRKSTFFHYFADKDALFQAAITDVLNDIAASVESVCADSQTFVEQLDAIVACLEQQLGVQRSLPRVLLRALIDGPQAGAPRPSGVERLVTRIADTVAVGVREGRVPVCDYSQTALAILMLVCGSQPGATSANGSSHEPLIGVTLASRMATSQAQVRRLLGIAAS